MTQIITDGVEFTKRTVKMYKKAKELQNQPVELTPEMIRAVHPPNPVDIWNLWSPDNKQMYKSNRYRGLKRAWQVWCAYISAGSYIPLALIMEKNKKKMLQEMEHGQK